MNSIRLAEKDVPLVLIHKDIQNLYLRIKPQGYLQLTVPKRTADSAVEAFVRRFEKKILSELNRIDSTAALENDSMLVWGERMACVRDDHQGPIFLREGILYLGGDSKPEKARRELERFYGTLILSETQKILAERVADLTEDFELSGISFKTQRMSSRLGSCKITDRVIKLNTVLGRFDRRYLEAILLHELCHLRVPNHGPDFYRLLEKYIPEYRFLRRELRGMVKTIGA